MAYVQPNSIIQLFKGINLDNRYLHTIYFANESAQNTWFASKVFRTFERQSYTRYGVNQIKLKADVTELLQCTYLRFMNDRSSDKWFYAFITGCEYINENTALVSFEIDVMQTWFISEGSVRPCLVLREHTNDDTFGINTEHEPVGSDVYDNDVIVNGTDCFNQYSVIVSTSEMPDNGEDYNNGLYCGTHMTPQIVSSAGTADQVTQFINQSVGSWDRQDRAYDIVDLYTFPTRFCNADSNSNFEALDVLHPTTLDGYTPKNNKLFCYPYSFLFATTMDGDSTQYRWEYFDGNNVGQNVRFEIVGNPLGGGSIICYPRAYNGIEYNYDAKLTMDNFPKNSANIDAYHAWIASGQATKFVNDVSLRGLRGQIAKVDFLSEFISENVNGVTGTLGGIGNVLTGVENMGAGKTSGIAQTASAAGGIGNALTGGLKAASTYGNYVASEYEAWNKVQYEFKDAMYTPNVVIGKNTPCVSVSRRALDFYFFNCHVRVDEAKRIDDFFSCYGYNVNRVKQPNITGRQYWNFVKTSGSVIAGNMPSSSKAAISKIFDGGITFWHDGDNVGNYAQSVSSGTINNPIIS